MALKFIPGKPAGPYRPSNGTEGFAFFASWCCLCARDKAMREGCDVADCDDDERCELIAASMAHAITDPEYPKAWQYGTDGQPCCTAYVEAGTPIPPTAEELEAAGQMRLMP